MDKISHNVFHNVHGGLEQKTINEGGKALLEFTQSYALMMVSTWLKITMKLIYWCFVAKQETQIDFLLARQSDKRISRL